MKRALTILFLFLTLFAVSQVADVKDLRIANNVTQFGANISIGGKVYDINAQELYVATAPVVSTATLTSAAASFKKITGDNASNNEIQDLSLTGNTLSLTGDATTVDLSAYVNAPASNYIQNQNASAQVADFWIDGSGVINDNFTKKVAGTYPTDYVVTDFPITQSAECIVILGEWKAGTYTTDAPYYVSGDFYFHNSAVNYGKNGVFKVVYNNGFSSTYQHAQSNYIGQRYANYPPYLVTFDYNGKTWMGIDLPAVSAAHGFTTGVFSGRKTDNVIFDVVEATAVTNKNAYIITDGTTTNIINSNLVIGGGAVAANNVQLTQKTTSTQETAGLGTELLTAANWTSTDWTGDFASGFTHTTGNITPLSNSYTGTIANIFKITITITGRTAGSVNILFGGIPYEGVSSTTSYSPRCTTTGNLSITPTTDFNGTVIVSLQSVISTIPSIHSVLNSSLIATNESRAAISGSGNMYDGYNTGRYTTTGTSNTGYGYNSMAYITSGSGNTAFGAGALTTNSVGNYNTAVGINTLLNNIYGAYNVGVGYATLQANTSGSQNIGIGRSALNNNSTGSNNIALGGRNTLYSNTTGGSNLGIGYYSLFSNQAGNYNTGINTNSLYYLNGGSYNIGIGYYALERLTDGNYNVGLGAEAGRYVGASGTTPNTSSDYSVFIGSGTRALADNDQNSIVLGHAAVGLGSNSAMIGGAAVTKFGIGGTEVFYQPLKTGSAGTLGNLLVSQGTTTAPAWVPPANIGLIGSVGLSATIIPVFNGSNFVNSNLRQNTYSTGSIRIHTNDVGGILGVGVDGGGFSGSIGSKYTAGDYSTYFGYDMYWQHDSAEWKANRTNMGNKILYKMSGSTGVADWYYYNGGGAGSLTTGWQTSDMSRAMSLNAISGKLTVRGQLQSEVATGTSPLDIASTTKVTNLNSDLFDGLNNTELRYSTIYNATNGVLITTDIDSTENTMFTFMVDGNGYINKRFNIWAQGYAYHAGNAILQRMGTASNYKLPIYFFFKNSKLNIWLEQGTSFQTFNCKVMTGYSHETGVNRITSISNAVKPTGISREVSFTPDQIYDSGNSNLATIDWTTKNLSVNGTATGTQDATLSNQFVRYGQLSGYSSSAHTHKNLVTTSGTWDLNTISAVNQNLVYDISNYASTNMFPASNNANAVLSLSTLSYGTYAHQLGFSSNSNMYQRYNSGSSWSTWVPIWTARNDGVGSGLSADDVDGITSEQIPYGTVGYAATEWNDTIGEIVKSGFYYNTGTVPDRPIAGVNSMIIHSNSYAGPGYALQIGARNDRYFMRTNENGTWATWKELYHSGNFAAPANVIDNGGLNLTANYIPKASDANTLTNSLIYDNGTNVGIGTNTPNDLLQVAGLLNFGGVENNTLVGRRAGQNIVTGAINNTFIGQDAGKSSATLGTNAADSNTAVGLQSFFSNTTGSNNSSVGNFSLFSNTTGNSNVAFGRDALYSNTTGSYNSAQGFQAGRYIADGTTGRTTGNYGIYLGTNTKASADGTTNEIVIGYNAIGQGSNTAVYGNTSMTKHIFSNGNVGIGINVPTATTHISYSSNNSLSYTDTGLKVANINNTVNSYSLLSMPSRSDGDGYWIKSITLGNNNSALALGSMAGGIEAEGVRIDNLGNVGIGTTSPTNTLDVNGNARFRSIDNVTPATKLLGTLNDGTLTTNVTVDTTDITGLLDFVENHSISSFTETDPIFAADSAKIQHWSDTLSLDGTKYDDRFGNTAYGWGNHAGLYRPISYVPAFSEITSKPTTLSGYGITDAVPSNRTLTINGTTYDLSANRSWTINSMVYPSAGIAVSTGTAWGTSITDNSANWNTAYTDRLKWDGGSTGLVAATGRTSLGASTIGSNVFTSTNPSAITFLRANADNTATWLSAADFRTAIGAGTSSTTGTVTSVAMSVPTGFSISGTPITTSGTLGLTFAAGYSLPTDANQTNWGSAYTFTSGFGTNYPDLTAIEALAGTTGLLRKTAANTWSLDNSTYLTSYTETDPVWSAAATNYYTKTNVQTSGQASIHWDNITNEPTFLTSYTETDPVFTTAFSGLNAFSIPYKTLLGTYLASNYTMVGGKAIVRTNPGSVGTSAGDFLLQVFGASYSTGQSYAGQDATTDSSLVRLGQVYTKTNLQTSGQSSIHWDNITNEPTFLTSSFALTGDLGGTLASPTVVNDSHDHTGTSISGLTVADFTSPNISNWTNDANYADKDLSNIFLDDQLISKASGVSALKIKDSGLATFGTMDADVGYFFVRNGAPYFVNGDFGSTEINLTPTAFSFPSAGIVVSTGTAWGASITDNSANWNTAYNDKVNSLGVTGTTTKTITLTQQDGGTVTGNFTDNNTYTSLTSLGGLGSSGSAIYLSSINASGGTPALTEYVHSLPSIGTTVKAVTWQAIKDMMGITTYTLPLAANGTRGGIQIGYTATGDNIPLLLSSEKAYVTLPTATTSAKGVASFSSTNFGVTSGAVSIATGGVTAMSLANGVISGQVDIGAAIVDADEMIISDSGTLRKTAMSRIKTYIGGNGWTDSGSEVGLTTTSDDLHIGDAMSLPYSQKVTVKGNTVIESNTGTYAYTLVVRDKHSTGGIHAESMTANYGDVHLNSGLLTLIDRTTTPTATTTGIGQMYAKDGLLLYENPTADGSKTFDLTNVNELIRTVSATGSTTLATTDKIILVTGAATVTIVYPTVTAGKVYTIRNTTGSTVNVPSYNVFGPSASTTVAAYQSITVVYNGSVWYQID